MVIRSRNRLSLFLVFGGLLLLVSQTGCMMVREGRVQAASPWPPQTSESKKSIGVTVTGQVSSDGKLKPMQSQYLAKWNAHTLKAYQESGLFSSVTTLSEATDLRAEVNIVESGSETLAFISGFISGFTFTLIPGFANIDVILNTTITNKSGDSLASFNKSESLSFWIEFFLLFAMPFHDSPEAVVKQTIYDLNSTTLSEARSKGIL